MSASLTVWVGAYGPAFFKEGHGDCAQNYMICFERRKACMILLTNSDNGEFAFRPLLETIFGNTFTPWEWEGYTPALIEAACTRYCKILQLSLSLPAQTLRYSQ